LWAEINKCDEPRTTTQREFIAKRTICWAWPEPHTWFAAAIKAPSVISDSAEKPPMVKKEQLKTPPKQSTHSEKIVYGAL